jgi:hypothetical protein
LPTAACMLALRRRTYRVHRAQQRQSHSRACFIGYLSQLMAILCFRGPLITVDRLDRKSDP